MKTLIICPTIFEALPVVEALGVKQKCAVGDCIESNSIVCLVSGIGCNCSAERVKSAVEKYAPKTIILSGFCGACKKTFANGDLIYETTSPNLAVLGGKLRGTRGKIACVEKIADTTKKIELGENGFDGVEMEFDFFKPHFANADFIHLRWISDSLESDIPPDFFESTMDKQTGELNLSVWNLIKSLVKSPTLMIKLAKFGKEIAPAKKTYSKAVKQLINILQNEC